MFGTTTTFGGTVVCCMYSRPCWSPIVVQSVPDIHSVLRDYRLRTNKLTSSMELSPSSEASSCTTIQECTNILWKPNILLFCPIHHQSRLYQTMLSLEANHLTLGFCSALFLSGLSTHSIYTCTFVFPNSCYMQC